jgi:hypothetical protein
VVVVEDVDVVETESRRLWSRLASKYLREPEVAVGSGPHVPTGLGGDDEFVAQAPEVLAEVATEVRFGAAVGRTVVVGEVEMGHAAVEGASKNLLLGVEGSVVAEVLPESERDCGQPDATLAASAVDHVVVTSW